MQFEKDLVISNLDKDKIDTLFDALGFSDFFEKEALLDESINTIIDLLYFIADNYGEESYIYRELAPIEGKLNRVLKLIQEEED